MVKDIDAVDASFSCLQCERETTENTAQLAVPKSKSKNCEFEGNETGLEGNETDLKGLDKRARPFHESFMNHS